MNQLIAYKGTNKVLIDIVNLFGFESVSIFKYYLLKDIKLDENNRPIISNDPEEMYELKFLEIPIEERDLSFNFRNPNKKYTYEEIVENDIYWGDSDANNLKQEILKTEFNYVATKFISISALFNITKVGTETNYFFNYLMETMDRGLLGKMNFTNTNIKTTGGLISLFNAFVMLQSLISYKFGYEDLILTTGTQISSLYNFNFTGREEELFNLILNNSYLNEKYQKVISLPEIIEDKRKLNSIFFENINFKSDLEQAMIDETNYDNYRTLKNIYNYNMYSCANKNVFKKGENEYYMTYREYLKDNDYELFNYIEEIIYKQDSKQIVDAILEITNSIEVFLDSENYNNIFENIIDANASFIREYIFELINHFKSYTVQLERINIIYLLDERFNNRIKLLDQFMSNQKSIMSIDNLSSTIYDDEIRYKVKSYLDDLNMTNKDVDYFNKLKFEIENIKLIDNKEIEAKKEIRFSRSITLFKTFRSF
jgi:hypothetical protein